MPSKEYMLRFDANLICRLNGLHQLLNNKHEKYGNQPIIKSGLMGLVSKLDIKVERLRNLEAAGSKTPDDFRDEWEEDVMDTLIDIAGYGMLGQMWLKGELK